MTTRLAFRHAGLSVSFNKRRYKDMKNAGLVNQLDFVIVFSLFFELT